MSEITTSIIRGNMYIERIIRNWMHEFLLNQLNSFSQMIFFSFFPQKLLDRKLSKNSSVSSESCITPATSPKHQGIYFLFIFYE